MFFATSKSRQRAKSLKTGESKTIDNIQIKIKMANLTQEPPASSMAPNEDFKDMDVLFTFKIKIESQNLYHGYIKQHIQINIKLPNSNQEPKTSSKTPNQDSKDMDVLLTLKIKKESQNLEYVHIKDQ